ncbi:MAG: hypothetical protein PHU71_06390 [Candidatus Gracilibacteria bacterium]|nr:hypothetical protein [Candidatus Gracilibacteria bacterium]
MRLENQEKDLATCLGELLRKVEHPHMDQGYCNVAIGEIRTLLSKGAAISEDQQLVADIQKVIQEVPEIPENGLSASAVSRLLDIPAIKAAWQTARSGAKEVLRA